MFVRVTEIRSEGVWRVSAGDELTHWPDRQAALRHARSLEPEWIEVGDVHEGQHVWTTLRRQTGGDYAESPLRWRRAPGA